MMPSWIISANVKYQLFSFYAFHCDSWRLVGRGTKSNKEKRSQGSSYARHMHMVEAKAKDGYAEAKPKCRWFIHRRAQRNNNAS